MKLWILLFVATNIAGVTAAEPFWFTSVAKQAASVRRPESIRKHPDSSAPHSQSVECLPAFCLTAMAERKVHPKDWFATHQSLVDAAARQRLKSARVRSEAAEVCSWVAALGLVVGRECADWDVWSEMTH